MAQRLFVNKILSIGVVEEGDNPPSEILLFKAKGKSPMSKDTENEILRKRPDLAEALGRTQKATSMTAKARGEAVARHIDKRLTEQEKALTEISEGYTQISKTIGEAMTGLNGPRSPKIAPPDTVKGKVDRIALDLIAKGKAANITEARPMVWKSRPDLVAASRANDEGDIHVAGGRKPEAGTVAEQISKVIHDRADAIASMPQMFGKSIADLRVEVWKSPDGRKLRSLYTDSTRHKPAVIEKSGLHVEAFRILKSWIADPATGIR